METIKSVAIIGAGALGLLYMDSIFKRSEKNAYFLTDKKRCDILKNKKIIVNTEECKFNFRSIDELNDSPDLILICVKNHHLEAISPILKKAAGPDTIIISVLNGIGSEKYLEGLLPDSKVLYAAVLGMDAVKEKESLTFTRRGKVLIGSKENKESSQLLKTCHFLKENDIEYIIPEDIHREIWYKWMINIGVNQVSAISGAPYGLFQTDKRVQNLMVRAMKETILIAEAERVNLCEDDLDRWYKVLNTLGPEGKTSMLQDVEAKRITEVDSFSGELLVKAAFHGLHVPVNETLYSLIKTKESLYL